MIIAKVLLMNKTEKKPIKVIKTCFNTCKPIFKQIFCRHTYVLFRADLHDPSIYAGWCIKCGKFKTTHITVNDGG